MQINKKGALVMVKEKIIVNYKGIDYEIVFNLNVMEEIQDEYGSIEAWGNKTDNETEPDMKAVIFGLTCMVNEGIEIYNEDNEDNEDFKPRKLLSKKQVGRLISEIGLAEVTSKLNKSVTESTKSDEKN